MVDAARGTVISAGDKVVSGHYASSNGGQSASIAFLWGGGVSHLQPVDDSCWENASGNPYHAVHLARMLWPRTPQALDHLISLEDTAADRGVGPSLRSRLLGSVDQAAVAAADIPVVDTDDHLDLLPQPAQRCAVVAPVGASDVWFGPAELPDDGVLDVVFFGLYTLCRQHP